MVKMQHVLIFCAISIPCLGSDINEISQYGKFEIVQIGEGCKVFFNHHNGKKYEVIKGNYCSAKGINRIAPTEIIGEHRLPIIDK
jgi:hypothetical protein